MNSSCRRCPATEVNTMSTGSLASWNGKLYTLHQVALRQVRCDEQGGTGAGCSVFDTPCSVACPGAHQDCSCCDRPRDRMSVTARATLFFSATFSTFMVNCW